MIEDEFDTFIKELDERFSKLEKRLDNIEWKTYPETHSRYPYTYAMDYVRERYELQSREEAYNFVKNMSASEEMLKKLVKDFAQLYILQYIKKEEW